MNGQAVWTEALPADATRLVSPRLPAGSYVAEVRVDQAVRRSQVVLVTEMR